MYNNPYLMNFAQFMPQQMTMPTIHADIIQVGGPEDVDRYSVGAGNSQMFITRDEATIFIKSGTANGFTLDVYDKRPPVQAPDPQTYVTRAELEAILGSLKKEEKV